MQIQKSINQSIILNCIHIWPTISNPSWAPTAWSKNCVRQTVFLPHDAARPCRPSGGFGLVMINCLKLVVLDHLLTYYAICCSKQLLFANCRFQLNCAILLCCCLDNFVANCCSGSIFANFLIIVPYQCLHVCIAVLFCGQSGQDGQIGQSSQEVRVFLVVGVVWVVGLVWMVGVVRVVRLVKVVRVTKVSLTVKTPFSY